MSETILTNFINFDKFVKFIKIWAEGSFWKNLRKSQRKISHTGSYIILWDSHANWVQRSFTKREQEGSETKLSQKGTRRDRTELSIDW